MYKCVTITQNLIIKINSRAILKSLNIGVVRECKQNVTLRLLFNEFLQYRFLQKNKLSLIIVFGDCRVGMCV